MVLPQQWANALFSVVAGAGVAVVVVVGGVGAVVVVA